MLGALNYCSPWFNMWHRELAYTFHSFVADIEHSDDLRQYFKVVIMTLLTRLQSSKTDKFVYLFSRFLLFGMAINVDGLSSDYIIGTLEEIQPQ